MRLRVYLAVLVAVVITLLAGCGGSSKSSSSSTNASVATATTGATGTTTTNPSALARRTAVRDKCLRKNGIKSQLPKGMARAQYQAIVTKCGLALPRGGALGSVKSRLSTPAAKQAFSKFVACMRDNGINMPAANTSGTGPVFSAKGLAIGTTKFDRAETKCRGDLRGAFSARPIRP